MEQKSKALKMVSWKEMLEKLRGLFSQLPRRFLPLGPVLHKHTQSRCYTERGRRREMQCEQTEFTFKGSSSALISKIIFHTSR